jgi:AcrR family transcriptional regulator
MPRRSTPATAPRKRPKQARSAQLVADILQAAIRVLEREGAQRFTTIRVAEQAGVSVGSLYQYFPNKQAILFRLQLDEWQATGAVLEAILGDTSRSPEQRLRDMVRAFFRSEHDEAPLRHALDSAAPTYRDAPEARAHSNSGDRVVAAFVAAAAPRANRSQRAFAAELVFATMTSIGKQVSERRHTLAEIDAWADAVSDMLLGYLASLGSATKRPVRRR